MYLTLYITLYALYINKASYKGVRSFFFLDFRRLTCSCKKWPWRSIRIHHPTPTKAHLGWCEGWWNHSRPSKEVGTRQALQKINTTKMPQEWQDNIEPVLNWTTFDNIKDPINNFVLEFLLLCIFCNLNSFFELLHFLTNLLQHKNSTTFSYSLPAHRPTPPWCWRKSWPGDLGQPYHLPSHTYECPTVSVSTHTILCCTALWQDAFNMYELYSISFIMHSAQATLITEQCAVQYISLHYPCTTVHAVFPLHSNSQLPHACNVPGTVVQYTA